MKTFPVGIAIGALLPMGLAQGPSSLDPHREPTLCSGAQLPWGRVPIHTAEPDSGQQYGVWAAGEAYKVGFHGDMTFVPFLGSDSPRNRSLS